MRRLGLTAGSLLLILGISAGSLEGQLRPWEISIAGGPTIPTGDLADAAGTGYHVQGSIGFGLPMLPFGIRADALWNEVPDETDGWFRQIGGLVNATIGVPLVIVEPYVLAGVGYLRTEVPDIAHAGHAHLGETENLVGFNAGAGVEFPFMGLSGFVEGRYLNLLGSDEAKGFQSIPITAGIRF